MYNENLIDRLAFRWMSVRDMWYEGMDVFLRSENLVRYVISSDIECSVAELKNDTFIV